MNILLIEDNIDHIEIICDTLAHAFGESISTTKSVTFSDGLEHLKNEVFDLCLCDLKLPDSPLQNTLDILSRTQFNTPIIVLTSINSEKIAIDLIKAGIQDYISKDSLDPEYLYKQCQFAIERKATQKELEEKTKDYEAFCHSLSHDFNGSIRRINQCTQFLHESLRTNYSLTEEEEQWLGFIEKNASEVQTLTNDLFRYLSADNESTRHCELVDLNEIVEKLTFDNDGALSVLDCNLPSIYGNASQLHLVFKNLIENSIKYNTNFPNMTFGFEIDQNKKRLNIHIDDNGVGIPEGKAPYIFLPFQRLDNKLGKAGSGLGLSLVYKIIKRMKGNISVEQSPLGGCRFKVRLPSSLLENP